MECTLLFIRYYYLSKKNITHNSDNDKEFNKYHLNIRLIRDTQYLFLTYKNHFYSS